MAVLRGGSGRWQLEKSGRHLAAGHVPRQAPFASVCARQIQRIAEGEGFHWPGLGGGHRTEVEVAAETPEKLIQGADAREAQYKERKAERKRKQFAPLKELDLELIEINHRGQFRVREPDGREWFVIPEGPPFYNLKAGPYDFETARFDVRNPDTFARAKKELG